MGELYDMDECGFPMLHRGVRTTCGKPTSFFYHNPPLDLVVCRCDEHMNLLYSERNRWGWERVSRQEALVIFIHRQ